MRVEVLLRVIKLILILVLQYFLLNGFF